MEILRNKNGRFAKGNKGYWTGKKFTEKHRKNLSESNKGHPKPPNAYSFPKGSGNPRYSGGEVKLHCILCGKEYFRERCRVKGSKFCSVSCKAKWVGRKNRKLSDNERRFWDKLKESEFYKKWRMKVFQRDRFTCRLCEHRGRKSKAHGDKTSDIHAHHIITMKDNIRLCLKAGNGITLCINCHRLTYGKEEKFAKVFKEILNDHTPNKEKS